MLVDTYAQISEAISGPTPLSLSNLREEDKNSDKVQQEEYLHRRILENQGLMKYIAGKEMKKKD